MLMRLGRPVVCLYPLKATDGIKRLPSLFLDQLAVMWKRIEFQPFVEEKIEPSVQRVPVSRVTPTVLSLLRSYSDVTIPSQVCSPAYQEAQAEAISPLYGG